MICVCALRISCNWARGRANHWQAALALSWIMALPRQLGVGAGMGVSVERRVRFQIIGMNMVMLVCGELR